MLSIHENQSLKEAGQELLGFITDPSHWVAIEHLTGAPHLRPGQNPDYQRAVGPLRICASVDITGNLGVFLRVAFKGPALSPMRAADHLEEFLADVLPLLPNSEWQVEIDSKRWVHFIRRYTAPALQG